MVKWSQKRLFLGLALLVSLALLVNACGSKPAQSTTAKVTASTTAAAAAKPTPESAKEKFPKDPVTLVLTHSAGGAIDTITRAIQPYLQKNLGVNVTIENKTGSGGIIAISDVYKAKPDGYTLLVTSNSIVPKIKLNPDALGFDSILKLLPVGAWLNADGNAIAVKKDSPYKTIEDLVKAAQTKNISIAIGGGPGSTDHITFLAFAKAYPGKYKFVPFNGSAEAVTAILGGHVDTGIVSLSGSAIDPKELNLLATTLDKRAEAFPNVKTFTELGHPEATVALHVGAFAPPGTDPARVKIIEAALQKSFDDPEFQKWAKEAKKPLGEYYGTEKWMASLQSFDTVINGIMPDLKASMDKAQGKK